jgi:hypothetical protein
MDKKLTDSEIIKALECCISNKTCEEAKCPLYENGCEIDIQIPHRFALDLINRLQAENERLQGSVDRYNIQVANQREQIEKYEPIKETLCVLWETMSSIGVAKGKEKPTLEELAEAVDHIKSEAYKEFAERLKEETEVYTDSAEDVFILAIGISKIDNLLKEMVGEQPISNDVKCKDCEYLELELPYAVCSKAYKGIVAPDDSCGKGKLKETVGDDDAKEKE